MKLASPTFGFLATLVSGVLFALSSELGPVGPLVFLAPIPLLLYALAAPRAWSVAIAALAVRLVGATFIYMVYGKIIPLPVLAIASAIFGALYVVVMLLTRVLARATPAWMAAFSYPLVLVTVEWIFGRFAPNGSFGATGNSLVDVLPLLQLASVGGLAALTFIAALVPMAIAVAISRPGERRGALLAGGLPLAAALVFGVVRLNQDYTSHARVALAAIDSTEAHAYRGEAEDVATAEAYAGVVRELGKQKPEFIVLPEKQFGGGRDGTRASAVLDAAAREAGPATLIAGFDEVLTDGSRVNAAQLLAGGPPARYVKRRLIPGLEPGYTIGTGSYVAGTRGVAICKDMDFPAMIRDYGARGVELMLVPAWDFVRDGRMHSRMAVVRGVENGFAIARAAEAGRLTASDAFGRVVAEAVTTRERPATLVADLGLRAGGTIYARIGDAFAWLCAVLAAALLLRRAVAVRARSSS